VISKIGMYLNVGMCILKESVLHRSLVLHRHGFI
jgi:hypothetical protein